MGLLRVVQLPGSAVATPELLGSTIQSSLDGERMLVHAAPLGRDMTAALAASEAWADELFSPDVSQPEGPRFDEADWLDASPCGSVALVDAFAVEFPELGPERMHWVHGHVAALSFRVVEWIEAIASVEMQFWNDVLAPGYAHRACSTQPTQRPDLLFRADSGPAWINVAMLERVFTVAATGASPPSVHIQLSAARNSHVQHDHESAVIGAAAAVEVAMAEVLPRFLQSSGNRGLVLPRDVSPSISQRVHLAPRLGLYVPDSLEVDLLDRRHALVYEGRAVSHPESDAAIQVAADFVRNHFPL